MSALDEREPVWTTAEVAAYYRVRPARGVQEHAPDGRGAPVGQPQSASRDPYVAMLARILASEIREGAHLEPATAGRVA